jgi:hypothetical protein
MDTKRSFFERYLEKNRDYLEIEVINVGFVRSMTVARYKWGYLIETEHIDEEGVTTLEVLASQDAYTAILINRERFGENHDDMKPYPRDSQFPIGCFVRLIR